MPPQGICAPGSGAHRRRSLPHRARDPRLRVRDPRRSARVARSALRGRRRSAGAAALAGNSRPPIGSSRLGSGDARRAAGVGRARAPALQPRLHQGGADDSLPREHRSARWRRCSLHRSGGGSRDSGARRIRSRPVSVAPLRHRRLGGGRRLRDDRRRLRGACARALARGRTAREVAARRYGLAGGLAMGLAWLWILAPAEISKNLVFLPLGAAFLVPVAVAGIVRRSGAGSTGAARPRCGAA